jgi:hypothetical protein
MSERVYLAARFGRRHELRQLAQALIADGHDVVSRWLKSENLHWDLVDVDDLASVAAMRDFEDVRAATVCVAFTEESGARQGRGGRHVEFGVAAALGLRLILVGRPEHIFHLLPQVERVEDGEGALAILARRSLSAA